MVRRPTCSGTAMPISRPGGHAWKMLLFDSIVVVRKPSGTFSLATVPPRSSANVNSAPPCTIPPLLTRRHRLGSGAGSSEILALLCVLRARNICLCMRRHGAIPLVSHPSRCALISSPAAGARPSRRSRSKGRPYPCAERSIQLDCNCVRGNFHRWLSALPRGQAAPISLPWWSFL
jgi:hypothetical protein